MYQYLYKKGHISTSAEAFISDYITLYKNFLTNLPMLTPLNFEPLRKKYIKKKEENMSHPPGYPYSKEEFKDLKERHEKLQKFLDTDYKGLKVWHLPDDIKEYLIQVSTPSYRQLALIKIDEIKAQTKQLIKDCKALEKKKPEERTLRAGHIAQILARDMVYLRKHHQHIKDGKVHHSKLNDEEYNRLQNLLAYFQKDDIQAHLDQYRLLELHPFLKDVKLENSKNLYEYYKKYLEKRKEYFIGVYDSIDLFAPIFKKAEQYLKKFHGVNKDEKDKKVKKSLLELKKALFNFDRQVIKIFLKNYITDWKGINLGNCKNAEDFCFHVFSIEKEFKDKTFFNIDELQNKLGYLFDFKYQENQPEKLDKNYAQIPIALPSSLFKDAIIEGIEKAMQKEGKKLTFGKDEEGNEKRTVVYALREWLENDTQVFYTHNRHYKMPEKSKEIFSKEQIKRIECQVISLENRKELYHYKELSLYEWIDKPEKYDKLKEIAQKDALKKFRSYLLSTEKVLRLEQHKDRVLWLLAKDLSENRTQGTNLDFKNFKLKDLEKFLDTPIKMEVKVNYIVDKEDIAVNNAISGKPCTSEKQLIEVGAVSETLKIKDYGDLRRFAKDRRLPNLFRYFYDVKSKGEALSKTELEKAITLLEVRNLIQRNEDGSKIFKDKITVLEKAMELEQLLHEKYGQPDTDFENTRLGKYWKQEQPKDSHISHNTYIKFLQDKTLGIDLNINPIVGMDGAQHLNNDKELAKSKRTHPEQTLEACLIILLRNKLIHNEVPYTTFLQSKMQADFTPEQVVRQIIDESMRIYDQLIAEVKKQTA
ncbi:type VI-B CRISPR-associated RNA-guided ribonuclease Cas13b [Thermoflexibacter ruber]|nr:type VI-B CRISPR-associated RNA-guided ribonuclease Cas13b [Thermoflexibacter ruber]